MASQVEEVQTVVNAFAEHWNEHDMAAFSGLFAPHAEFVNVVGLWWKGRDEIREAHEQAHASIFRDSRLTMLDTRVRFAGGNVAIARSKWTLEGHRSPAGEALPPRSGLLLNILDNTGGRWLIIESQNTDIVEGVASRPQ